MKTNLKDIIWKLCLVVCVAGSIYYSTQAIAKPMNPITLKSISKFLPEYFHWCAGAGLLCILSWRKLRQLGIALLGLAYGLVIIPVSDTVDSAIWGIKDHSEFLRQMTNLEFLKVTTSGWIFAALAVLTLLLASIPVGGRPPDARS